MSMPNINEEAIVQAVINAINKVDGTQSVGIAEIAKDSVKNEMNSMKINEDDYVSDDDLLDYAAIPEEEICLIDNPKNKEALMRLKRATPAHTASGRAGTREKTIINYRKIANWASAVDAVYAPLDRKLAEGFGFPIIKSKPNSKEEYLMRPDLGCQLDDENMNIVRTKLKKNPEVQIVIGEGQSAIGLEKSMPELLPALLQGLELNKIDYGTPVFVEYTRVKIGDLIAQEVGAQAVCVILGERPGLQSWDGLGCYLCYDPKVGILESKRICVSNIQDNGGTPPAEAGAYIADLIARVLKEKASGVDLII